MKSIVFVLLIVGLFSINGLSQSSKLTPATIILKEGKQVDAHHFGQKDCTGSSFYTGYILVKGKYEGAVTEIKKYHDIMKLDLIGFEEPPVSSVGNEKARIVVYKDNGVAVELDEAELIVSCFNGNDKYNQIKVQVINPLSEKVVEKTIDTKDIKTIIFN